MMQKVIINDCTLYLGDSMDILPTLGKVDAVADKSNAVVFNDSYDKTASGKHSKEPESGSSLGSQAGGYCGAVCERGYVASSNGGEISSYLGGLSEGSCSFEDSAEIAGKGWQQERTLQGWHSEHGLSQHDREETLQQVRGNQQSCDSPQGQCSHEQRAGEFRSPLQPMSQQTPQARMVELPKGWALLTDPPYGINYHAKDRHTRAIEYGYIHGDNKPFDPAVLLDLAIPSIIWGGNNFANMLPIGGWIVWDKRLSEAADKILGSPFELAWCSNKKLYKIVRLLHGGAKNADALNGDVANEPRYHPTQKPIRLMQACISHLPNPQTILDPFMGSGSTGVACVKMGRKFIGIEREPQYFEIACRRIEEAYKQPDMFIAPAPRPKQESML